MLDAKHAPAAPVQQVVRRRLELRHRLSNVALLALEYVFLQARECARSPVSSRTAEAVPTDRSVGPIRLFVFGVLADLLGLGQPLLDERVIERFRRLLAVLAQDESPGAVVDLGLGLGLA